MASVPGASVLRLLSSHRPTAEKLEPLSAKGLITAHTGRRCLTNLARRAQLHVAPPLAQAVARLGVLVAGEPGLEALGQRRPVLERVARAAADAARRGRRARDAARRRSACRASARTGRRAPRPAARPPAPGSGGPGRRARSARARPPATRSAVVEVLDRRSVDVGRDLHAAPVEVAEPVGRAVVVDPARHAGRRPAAVGGEVEDVLLGDAQVEQPRRTAAASTRRTPRRRGRPRARGRRRARHARRRAARSRSRRAPRPHRPRRQRAHAVARVQDPGLGLVQRERQVVGAHGREQLARRRRARTGCPARAASRSLPASQPSSRRANHATPASATSAGSSSRHRSQRAARAERVCRVVAVRAADQPRLVAAARAHVPGRELLDERDVPRGAREPVGERGAEDTGADDDDANGTRRRGYRRRAGRATSR